MAKYRIKEVSNQWDHRYFYIEQRVFFKWSPLVQVFEEPDTLYPRLINRKSEIIKFATQQEAETFIATRVSQVGKEIITEKVVKTIKA